jgi:ubiquinol-cytochrome c reductase cytochrome b/c1 subunit
MPEALGDVQNSIPANPLVTPPEIKPEWYLRPYYAILRAIPDKLTGVIALAGALGCIFALPWLDTSKVRSMRYRPQARVYFWLFVLTCAVLGVCGGFPPDKQLISWSGFQLFDSNVNSYVWLSRLATAYFFLYFLVITPLLGLRETPLPVPDSISTPVLAHPAAPPVGAVASPETEG